MFHHFFQWIAENAHTIAAGHHDPGHPIVGHGHDHSTSIRFGGYEGNGVWKDDSGHLHRGNANGPEGGFDQVSW